MTVARLGLLAAVGVAACGSASRPSSAPDAGDAGTGAQSAFYVAPGGTDDAPGTMARPFATLARAQQAIRALLATGAPAGGATVVLRDGVHRLDAPLVLGPEDSGTPAAPVVFRALEGERPVISGGQRITGWQPAAGMPGVWSAATGTLRSRQLFVGGVRAARAAGVPPVVLTQVIDGFDAPDETFAGWRRPTDLEFVWEGGAGPWASPRCPVWEVNRRHVAIVEPCWHNVRMRDITVPGIFGPPTRIENALELLDQPGEFYLDQTAGTIFYRPRATEEMATAEAVAPMLEALLVIRGTAVAPAHDIRIEGIQFSHATWLGPSGDVGFPEVQANFYLSDMGTPAGSYNQGACDRAQGANPGSCPFGSWAKSPAAVTVTAARSVRFQRDVFAHLGGAGLTIERGSGDVVVEGCLFTDTSASAIQIGDGDIEDAASPDVTHDVVLSNDWIHHTPVEYAGGVGVFIGQTRDVTVSHSQIDHTSYSGISAGWGWSDVAHPRSLTNPSRRTKILFNRVFAHNLVNQDGDAIYTNGVMGTSLEDGALIEGNVLSDGTTIDGGLYTDGGARWITLQGNVTRNWHGCFPIGDMLFQDNDVVAPSSPLFDCPLQAGGQYPVTVMGNRTVTGPGDAAPDRLRAAGLTADFTDVLALTPL